MTRLALVAAIFALLLAPTAVEARTFRVDQVPHGPQFSCDVCHLPAGGLNDFGFDAFLYLDSPRGNLDWSEMWQLDSDRDGYTNGEELGDPQGMWRIGDPHPSGEFSHPGDREDGLCGNGVLESSEPCEADAGTTTCESLGLGPGSVTCREDCTFDTSSCDSCGDGVKHDAEPCDGTDLGGTTCMFLGFGGGTLACTGCQYDTSGCTGGGTAPGGTCGDGAKNATELCDGSDLGGETCATLGYDGGLLACREYCTFDTTGCHGDVADVAVVDYDPGSSPEPQAPMSEPSNPDAPVTLEGQCAVTHGDPSVAGWLLWILAVCAGRRLQFRS